MALYVMSAFVLGLVIGPLVSWWPHKRLRMRYNKQVKQLKACEQRIKALQETAVAVEDAPVVVAVEAPKAS